MAEAAAGRGRALGSSGSRGAARKGGARPTKRAWQKSSRQREKEEREAAEAAVQRQAEEARLAEEAAEAQREREQREAAEAVVQRQAEEARLTEEAAAAQRAKDEHAAAKAAKWQAAAKRWIVVNEKREQMLLERRKRERGETPAGDVHGPSENTRMQQWHWERIQRIRSGAAATSSWARAPLP